MKKPPCYKCAGHTAECHATCAEYRDWSETRKKQLAAMRNANEIFAHIRMAADAIKRRRNTR